MASRVTARSRGDAAPLLRPAGSVTSIASESVAACIKHDHPNRPTTPPEISKYRKSTIHEPGKIVKHYGAANNVIPHPKDEPFGYKSGVGKGEGVAEVIKNFPESELMQWRLERQEDVYASSKREPLGQSYNRGHKLPQGLGTDVPFGEVCEQGGVVGAKAMMQHPLSKELIFPVDFQNEDPDGKFHDMYVRTHASYAPGQQRQRNYNWEAANIEPGKHTFGLTEKVDPNNRNGVAKALNPQLGVDYKDTAKIVPAMLEHFYITEKDHLGQVKKLGHGNRNIPPDFAYGAPSEGRNSDSWGVRKLLVGGYTEEQQIPDVDLGKSIKPGHRNLAPDDKVFGLPSVRTDIMRRYPQPTKQLYEAGMTVQMSKGCADNTNYGEEPDAFSLIYPAAGGDRGVEERMYLEPYTAEKLKAFLGTAGINTGEFDSYFDNACAVDNFTGGSTCCILTYQRVKRHFEQQKLLA